MTAALERDVRALLSDLWSARRVPAGLRRRARRITLRLEAARHEAREAVRVAVESLEAAERRENFQDRKSEAAR